MPLKLWRQYLLLPFGYVSDYLKQIWMSHEWGSGRKEVTVWYMWSCTGPPDLLALHQQS